MVVVDHLVLMFEAKFEKLERMNRVNSLLDKMNVKISDSGQTLDRSTGKVLEQREALNRYQGAMRKVTAETRRMRGEFDMNNLSLLFGGMMLQRFGLSILRFAVPSMDKLEKLNTTGAKKVMGMTAAFEFLKVSLFETLSTTPLFNKFVELFIKFAVWVSDVTQKNPSIIEMAAALGGLAAIFGTAFIAGAFVGQVEHIINLLTGKSALSAIANARSLTVALKGLGALGALGVTLAISWDLLANKDTAMSRFMAVLGGTLGGTLAGALMASLFGATAATGAIIAAPIALATMISIAIIDYRMEELGMTFQDALLQLLGQISFANIVPMGNLMLVNLNLLYRMTGKIEQPSMDTKDMEKLPEKVSESAEQYSFLFANQLQSNEKTNELIENTERFGKTVDTVFGNAGGEGEQGSGVIGKFSALASQIINDTTLFRTLRDEVEAWASTETVKTVRINYVASGDTGAAREAEGGGIIDKIRGGISSITTN